MQPLTKRILKQIDWVKKKLIDNPKLRDSNARLYYNYLLEIDYDVNKSIKEFLKDIESKRIPYIDSIARCSRKVQEEFPELEGRKRSKRKEREQEVKQEIKSYKS